MELGKLEGQVAQLLTRTLDTSVIVAYEDQVRTLEHDKLASSTNVMYLVAKTRRYRRKNGEMLQFFMISLFAHSSNISFWNELLDQHHLRQRDSVADLRTGKSGQYRYLVCANRATKATFACNAPQIRMEVIDELVLSAVETHVLAPQRMLSLLQAMLDRQDGRRPRSGVAPAKGGAQESRERPAQPLCRDRGRPDLVRLDDPISREQMALLGRQRAEISASIPVLEERLRAGPVTVSDKRISTFSRTVRDRLRSADPSFRRQWLHLFVDEVVIGRSEIVISGRNNTLLNGVTGRTDFFFPSVPRFDQEWRASQNKTGNTYTIDIAI